MRRSPCQLLKNFLRHVLKVKSGEELQQQLYSAVMTRQKDGDDDDDDDDVLTLTTHDNTEVQVEAEPLLSCLRASGLPVNNIKTVRAELDEISESQWDSLYVQTGQGSDTELEVTVRGYFDNYGYGVCVDEGWVDYSPQISEMLRSARLTKFR